MQKTLLTGAFAAAATVLTPTAQAQDVALDLEVRAVLAAGVFVASGRVDGESLVGRAVAGFAADTVFSNGLRITAVGRVGVGKDQYGRDPRGGRAGECPAGAADCAGMRASVSGFVASGASSPGGLRAAVQAAYVSFEGGLGEVTLGLDQGAAARFSLTPPSILAATSSADGALSVTGMSGAIVINDMSGASTKLVYATPRVLGLRAAVSFAPESDVVTLDQGFPDRAGTPQTFDAENSIEAGLSFSRNWRNGLRTNAALTALHAADGSANPLFDDITTLHVGASVGVGPVDLGAAYLTSNNGWRAGDRGYKALAASSVYTRDRWAFMLEAAAASDDLAHVSLNALTLAARRVLNESVSVSVAATHQRRTVPSLSALGRSQIEQTSTGLFLEFAVDL